MRSSFAPSLAATALAATALGAVATVGASAASADPLIYVYKGAGCDGAPKIASFEQAAGVKVDGATEFLSAESWPQLQSGANWALGCWQKRPGRLSVAVPLIVKGANFADAASGKYDQQYAMIGKALVSHGQSAAFVRLGWEFNGNWYPWSANKDPAGFKAAFRHVVAILRKTPGQHFAIVWNPSIGTGDVPLDQLYPGDDVVDLIGADVYNQSWRPQDKNDPVVRWQGLNEGPFGLGFVRHFAINHHKRLVVPEWGTGTRPDGHGFGDDPLFVHKMAAWMRQQNVIFQGYWDFPASDYNAELTGGRYPLALAAFRQEFDGKH